jgi:TetR/AcrR family transcriptional repressor of nem operon
MFGIIKLSKPVARALAGRSWLMKKSKLETAETRRRIVRTAAAAFRRNGIHATGLADVMVEAGLTHGGFYRHFDSKDQLVAETCAAAMQGVEDLADAVACQKDGKDGLALIADWYLSTDHRDNRSGGCQFAALGSELARSDGKTRAAATAGFLRLAEVIARQYRRTGPGAAKARAVVALSAMVGAVTLSRIVTDRKLSAALLSHTRNFVVNA